MFTWYLALHIFSRRLGKQSMELMIELRSLFRIIIQDNLYSLSMNSRKYSNITKEFKGDQVNR